MIRASMHRSLAAVVLAGGLIAGGAASATSTPAPVVGSQAAAATCTTSPDRNSWSRIAWDIYRKINEQRTQNGVKPLTVDPGVTDVAIAHSVNMARTGIFSHVIDGKGPADRLRSRGVSFTGAGENIVYNYCQTNGRASYDVEGFAEQSVTRWMNSPGHRRNILDPNFNYTGVGVAAIARDGKGWIYSTQVFIQR